MEIYIHVSYHFFVLCQTVLIGVVNMTHKVKLKVNEIGSRKDNKELAVNP